MVLESILWFVVGLVLLGVGAEALVHGASRLASTFQVSPLVIGLTIVAFGTSAPELVVSVTAALAGTPEIAVGNAVGSNVFNTLLVLGPAALITPLAVHANLIRREIPLMLLAFLLFFAFALGGTIGRVEGGTLLAGLVGYVILAYAMARRESREVKEEFAEEFERPDPRHTLRNVLLVAGGLALLVLGGRVVVSSAVDLARAVGLSERVIAVTLIAAGTSLPEVAATLAAAVRKHTDIALGNVVGSSIFNILGIIGAAALVRPLEVPQAMLVLDIPIMLLLGFVLLPLAWTQQRVSRGEGAALVAGYGAYLFLLLRPVGLG